MDVHPIGLGTQREVSLHPAWKGMHTGILPNQVEASYEESKMQVTKSNKRCYSTECFGDVLRVSLRTIAMCALFGFAHWTDTSQLYTRDKCDTMAIQASEAVKLRVKRKSRVSGWVGVLVVSTCQMHLPNKKHYFNEFTASSLTKRCNPIHCLSITTLNEFLTQTNHKYNKFWT